MHHKYERIESKGTGQLLYLDLATGAVCSPMKPFEDEAAEAAEQAQQAHIASSLSDSSNPFMRMSERQEKEDAAQAVKEQIAADPMSHVPACQ